MERLLLVVVQAIWRLAVPLVLGVILFADLGNLYISLYWRELPMAVFLLHGRGELLGQVYLVQLSTRRDQADRPLWLHVAVLLIVLNLLPAFLQKLLLRPSLAQTFLYLLGDRFGFPGHLRDIVRRLLKINLVQLL